MAQSLVLNFLRFGVLIFLVSCKTPEIFSQSSSTSLVSSSSSDTSSISTEDQDVLDSISERAEADSRNGLEGDVYGKPFLNLAFSASPQLHLPQQGCVVTNVLEDSDVKRSVLYEYECQKVEGTVHYTTEQKYDSFYSVIISELDLVGKSVTKHYKNRNARERFKSGSVIEDQEFSESFTKDGAEHLMQGVSTYDFTPDTSEAEDGSEIPQTHSGVVQLDGTLTHTKNGQIQSVRVVHSENLHRSACGFDEGKILIKSSEKTMAVNFTACGKKTVTVLQE